MLLSHPEVINLVVKSLVDANIPANSYAPTQTEWSDGSSCDMLYASHIKSTKLIPPILIEIQYHVDQNYMLRLIKYASHTYIRYKLLPIVLVIITNSFSSTDFGEEFTINKNKRLLEASCKLWAKQCAILTPKAGSNYVNQEVLDPIVALGLFLTYHEVSEIPEHHKSNK